VVPALRPRAILDKLGGMVRLLRIIAGVALLLALLGVGGNDEGLMENPLFVSAIAIAICSFFWKDNPIPPASPSSED
jgi:hypothetical protein